MDFVKTQRSRRSRYWQRLLGGERRVSPRHGAPRSRHVWSERHPAGRARRERLVWPTLLVIARDSQNLPRATRLDAAFWLSRFAEAAIGGEHRDLVTDDSADDARNEGEDGLRNHAVFVLSQLPRREGLPALLEIVRSNHDRKVRRQALFWLGQSGDARALALFESLLRG